MSNKKQRYGKKRRKKLINIFIATFMSVLAVFAVLSVVIVVAWNYLNESDADSRALAKELDSNLKQGGSIGDLFSGVKEHINFVVLGVDKEQGGIDTRSDFMMVGCFNTVTMQIDLISLPRDTRTVIPDNRMSLLKWKPSNSVVKLGEVHFYAGDKNGVEFIVKQIEELMNIEIEYYVKLDTEAFKYLVDEVGGIKFDVPQRMYYNDPEQGLYIDLYPGEQVLNGEQSEGLVRYRKADADNPISPGYAMGDLKRAEVQQDFIKALLTQVISSDKIVSNIVPLTSTVFKYVKTNFPASDAPKFIKYLTDVKPENIRTHTLPGTAMSTAPYHYTPDAAEISVLVDEIFYSASNQTANK